MDRFTGAWKGILECEGCSTKSPFFRRKKPCFSCRKTFCAACITKRPDKKMFCRKCQILTATPLDKNELLNLKSRDLVNYLAKRHISTSGCIEKEDLVNVLMRAVNNSSSSSSHSVNNSGSNSYSNSPFRSAATVSAGSSQTLHSEDTFNDDGIRITGTDIPDNDGSCSASNHSSDVEPLNNSDWVLLTENNAESREFQEGGDSERVRNPENIELDHSLEANEMTTTRKETIVKPLKLSDIRCTADLDNLSVKELKILLMTNRTDFKGCVERAELLEKASRLWSDYMSFRRDLEKLSLEELCKICMDAPIECVLLECGHLATCVSCGKQLSECPVCRQYVTRCVRTFKA